MPEDKNNPAAGAGDDDKGAGTGEGQGGDDQKDTTATDTGENGGGKGTDEGAKADNTDKGDNAGDGKEKKDAKAPDNSQQDDDVDDGQEPPQRKRLSTQDFIIGRQRKKLSKAAKADGEGEGEGKDNNDAGEDDDGIAPEDEELITKVVAKKFAPIIDKSLAADDEQEIQDFLKTNPDFKPFEVKVRRFMQHPSRRALPIKSIFYEVAGDKLIKIGAERAKQADKKAKDSQTGGGSNRGGEANENVWDLTPEQFAARQEKIRRGQA